MGLLLMCVAGPPYFIKAYPCISQPFIPFTFVLYVPWLFKQVYHGNGSDRAGYSMLENYYLIFTHIYLQEDIDDRQLRHRVKDWTWWPICVQDLNITIGCQFQAIWTKIYLRDDIDDCQLRHCVHQMKSG